MRANESQQVTPERREGVTYSAPELRRLGSLTELTLGMNGTAADMNNQTKNN